MTSSKIAGVLFCWALAFGSYAGELRDPHTRDESISGATVYVVVTKDAGGLYRYEYTIQNPQASLGTILNFSIDVACPQKVPPRVDLGSLGLKTGSVSETGNHVPVAIGGAITDGVSAADTALWLIDKAPGETAKTVIVSAYGPGNRSYKLEPYMSTEGWDYETYSSDEDPTVPWIEDFTVTGITRGPACPGEEEPVEPPHFAGTLYPNETETINNLLTYSEPLRDRFQVEVGTSRLKLTIHYAKEIDPRSFRIFPEEHRLHRLFHPEPGTSETVVLPLEKGRNRFQLQARPKEKAFPRRKMKEESYCRRGPEVDQDEFEVRVGEPHGERPPKGRPGEHR